MKLLCSKCNVKKHTSEFHEKPSKRGYQHYCKRCMYDAQMHRWLLRKKEAIKLLGGKCCKCGYDKNYTALEFHHLNPDEKEFDWAKARQLSWDKTVIELQKCILLCANCHREVHYPEANFDQPKFCEQSNKTLQDKTIQPTGKCECCGLSVYGTKYCSPECSSDARRKVKRPSKEELKLLIETHSWCKLGRMFGVSDNSVRKWARQYQIL